MDTILGFNNQKMYPEMEDTMANVFTHGQSLEVFECMARDGYYNEGLFDFKNPEYSGSQGFNFKNLDITSPLYQSRSPESFSNPGSPGSSSGSFGCSSGFVPSPVHNGPGNSGPGTPVDFSNLFQSLQEPTFEEFFIAEESNNQQTVPKGPSPVPDVMNPMGTFYPTGAIPQMVKPDQVVPIPSEENSGVSMEDLDLLNCEGLDLSGLSEMEGCNLLDIIEADMDEEPTANDNKDDMMLAMPLVANTDFKAEQKAANNPEDLSRNQYFLQDKDTSKETRPTKAQKSSMIRNDVRAILLRCQVCGGRASGYHYGADTCGACKIFFARYNQKSPPHTCIDRVTGKVLKYNSKTAGPCPGCRLQKCFQVGMDIKASKKGRYSYKRKYDYIKKTKDEKQLQLLPVCPGDIIDDVIIMASHISDLFLSCKTYRPDFFEKIKDFELQYLEHCKFNLIEDKMGEAQVTDVNGLVRYGPYHNGRQIFVQRFRSLDRRVKTYISFARKIPGFNDLPKEDQISCIKGGAVFLSKLSEYRAYNVTKGLEILPEGHVLCKDSMNPWFSTQFVDMVFGIAGRCQKLNLNENERNLLKCVAFFSSEFCCTPKGKAIAEKHQDKMIKAFSHLIRKNRENNSLENCGRVIGNSMNVLGDIHVFKDFADRRFLSINRQYPAVVPDLLLEVIRD